jgi:hypothetical protein
MPHQVVWRKLSVTDQTDPDKPIEHILPQGAVLPDFVDHFTLFVLTTSGAIRAVEEPDPALLAALAPQQVVLQPEHAPGIANFDEPGYGLDRSSIGGLAAGSGAEVVDHTTREGRAKLAGDMGDRDRAEAIKREPRTAAETRADARAAAAGTGAGTERPDDNAPKADWVAYARSRATTARERNEVESATKADLITRYG